VQQYTLDNKTIWLNSWIGVKYFNEYLKIFKTVKNKTIINYIPQEHSPALEYSWYDESRTKAVEDALVSNNNQLVHLLGGFHGSKPELESMANTKVVYWPTYWFHHAYHNLSNFDEDCYKIKKDKLYVCLNRRPHLHRAILMDQLAKQDLLDKGYVTWHGTKDITDEKFHFCNVPFQYFDGNPITLDGEVFNSNQYNPPDFFDKGLVNVIAETSSSMPFITEKTVTPILRKKPFLVLGCQYFYKSLQSLGFKLLTDFFDYSFDFEPSTKLRAEMIVANVEKLKGHDFNDLYQQMLPVLEYNSYVAKKIVMQKDPWIPKDILIQLKKKTMLLDQDIVLGNIFDTHVSNK